MNATSRRMPRRIGVEWLLQACQISLCGAQSVPCSSHVKLHAIAKNIFTKCFGAPTIFSKGLIVSNYIPPSIIYVEHFQRADITYCAFGLNKFFENTFRHVKVRYPYHSFVSTDNFPRNFVGSDCAERLIVDCIRIIDAGVPTSSYRPRHDYREW